MRKLISSLTILSTAFIISACADDEENNLANNNMNNQENNNEVHSDDGNMNNHENENENDGNDHMADHGHSDGQHDEFASEPENMNPNAEESLMHNQTKNVTRLDANSAVDMSIYTSQLVWPATHEENQPGTIILAPLEDWQKSLVSTTLIHHPNDGPVLFMEDGEISDEVLTEIERLNPIGNEDGVELMVIGDASEETLSHLNDFNLEEFDGNDAAGFAADIDDYFSDMIGDVPESVIVASSEEEAKHYSLIASNWIAHMNESLLYVDNSGVPESTVEALEKREGNAKIYVLGSEEMIESDTIDSLSEYGEVERISGETPTEMSIEFAKYQDPDTTVGWGQDEPGHGLSFISTETPDMAITGSALGHLGKHAPLVWLEDGEVTESLYEYLADIRPTFDDNPMGGPYNHSYLLAGVDHVPFSIQGILDEKLEIAGEHGDH
ncbi:cell wall-binding repeat-containing protein [Salipaludibacillus daqingensis]|uniref:cell wall-binding repeat-containing protein n=1 Tax=Salipaludibacillus daqingensis TaxID=3041001 RepID=UPI002473ADF4|nr:cell wall-binding repeat-containing protein [Salipaludibacillus daqingensis]